MKYAVFSANNYIKQLPKKIKILWWMLFAAFESWKKEVYQRDLHEHQCCAGYECLCGGMTIEEMWSDIYDPN